MKKPIGFILLITLLILNAIIAGFYGLTSLSEATKGVGFICYGCLVAIMARIAQATKQHNAMKQLINECHTKQDMSSM